jgi:hypothetical protein
VLGWIIKLVNGVDLFRPDAPQNPLRCHHYRAYTKMLLTRP